MLKRDGLARLGSGARGWMAGAFSDHLLYKGAALFLSLVLWLAVNGEEPYEDTVPVELVLELDSTLALVGGVPPVQAQVIGPARDVTKLRLTPPEIRRTIPGDVGDSVRFDLSAADVLAPPGVDVDVRRVEPGAVTLHFTTRVQRRVPVRSRVHVTVDSALRAIGGPRLMPDSVTVVGTRSRVEAVEWVPTEEADVVIHDTLGVLMPLDTTGLGVQVSPARVRIRVPVVRDTLLPIPALLPWGRRPQVRRP